MDAVKRIEDLKQDLKSQHGMSFLEAQEVQTTPGLPTGHTLLDQFLPWEGIPVGALSVFYGEAGLGGTQLWLQTAQKVLEEKKWAAWVNSSPTQLQPYLFNSVPLDLSRLLMISSPKNPKEYFWVLEEMLSLSLFELIGCALNPDQLGEARLVKLYQIARHRQTALVFVAPTSQIKNQSIYSLRIQLNAQSLCIERLRHRPTPKEFTRRNIYADFMYQLAKNREALSGRKLPRIQSARALS